MATLLIRGRIAETHMEWQETVKALGGIAVLGKDVVSGSAFVRKIERVRTSFLIRFIRHLQK